MGRAGRLPMEQALPAGRQKRSDPPLLRGRNPKSERATVAVVDVVAAVVNGVCVDVVCKSLWWLLPSDVGRCCCRCRWWSFC